jgi:hypothetical protein
MFWQSLLASNIDLNQKLPVCPEFSPDTTDIAIVATSIISLRYSLQTSPPHHFFYPHHLDTCTQQKKPTTKKNFSNFSSLFDDFRVKNISLFAMIPFNSAECSHNFHNLSHFGFE